MSNTQLAISENTSVFSSKDKFELAGRMATTLSKSTIVPKEYQGNACNCLLAIELASRMNASPLMVMQNLYIVYGRPSWSAQYLIGQINKSKMFDFELQFDEKTDKDGKPYSCQCWTEKNGRKVTGPIITMDMAKAEGWLSKNGSKWLTMPQMMLRYRAASFFCRMNCPEVAMGYYTQEEAVEIGPEKYREVPVQTVQEVQSQVQQEIAINANATDFDEEVIDTAVVTPAVEHVAEAVPVKEEAPAETPKPKRSTKKAEPKPEPELIPDEVADDEMPEWGIS